MNVWTREEMGELLSSRPMQRETARQVFDRFVQGGFDEVQAAGILGALQARGETETELCGAAQALLDAAVKFPNAPRDAMDIVGTGGDGQNTLNISTLAAITAVACDVPIAKHGNRSITSLAGSFDLLRRLGVDLEMTPGKAATCLDRCGLCFLFAPSYHTGLRHVAGLRRQLNARTIFNLLGPLVNPARPRSMLLGVARPELLTTMGNTLRELGCAAAAIVHGSGLDEVALHGPTQVVWLAQGRFMEGQLNPSDFGLPKIHLNDLTCSQAEECFDRAVAILAGRGSVEENAAIAANVALAKRVYLGTGRLDEFAAQALDALRQGSAGAVLARFLTEAAR